MLRRQQSGICSLCTNSHSGPQVDVKTYQRISFRHAMLGLSWLKSRLVSSARISYNSGNYRSVIFKSRLAIFLDSNRNSYDLLARSYLRIKNYKKAKKIYLKAELKGYELLDHNKNRFASEIGSSSLVGAYAVTLRERDEKERNSNFVKIQKNLKKISEQERIEIIQEMSEMGKLPKIISKLLPWTEDHSHPANNFGRDLVRLSSNDILLDRYKRELFRVKSSGAYQILDHVALSLHSPIKIMTLPFTITKISYHLLKKRLGKLSVRDNSLFHLDGEYNKRDCVVLFPTNGVGFGHFTRMMALAKAIKKESKTTEIVFFTTMPTLHLVSEEGFIAYHLPGRYRYESMEPRIWNTLCEEILNLVLLQHSPSHFVFDGAYPYRGMLDAISNIDPSLNKIWLKRGTIKPDVKKLPVDSYGYFDAILRPGDSTETDFSDEFDHGLKLKEVGPMLIYDRDNSNPNSSLRKRLDIPKDSVLAYVQLGAGKINDIDNVLHIVLASLNKYPQCYVIMAESLIGERLDIGQERLRLLRDFPNSRWFNDIDFSIIAGGYNSYHEMVEFCIPSIVIPNIHTGRDDQVARIMKASQNKAMVMLKNPNKMNIEASIERIMEDEVRDSMSSKIQTLRKENGAREAARWILNLN